MITLDIVIVNWNAGLQLEDCINSILKCNDLQKLVNNIIVVDNGSTDDSMDFISTLNNDLIEPIFNKKNKGFAKSCNIGAAHSGGSTTHILFLNPDTILFEDTIVKTVDCMKYQDDDIGIVGIQLLNTANQISTSCSRFPSVLNYTLKAFGLLHMLPFAKGAHMTDFNHMEDREVNQVMGAFYIINKDIFIQLDGFDERFFVYYEEVDLAYRALRENKKSVFYSGPKAIHVGGGASSQVKDKRLFYSSLSRILYFRKHFNKVSFFAILFISLIIEPSSRIVFSIVRRDLVSFKNILSGYNMLYMQLLKKGFSF